MEVEDGIPVDFNVTNEDIVGFLEFHSICKPHIHDLKEEGVVEIHNQKLLILDKHTEEFTGRESFSDRKEGNK